MTITQDYIELARSIDASIELPKVSGIYLPEPSDEEEYKDEFGFIFLDDDTVGPFYTSLPGELPRLWEEREKIQFPCSLISLVEGFSSSKEAIRGFALGAFNAMSQHILIRSEWNLWPEEDRKGVSVGGVDVEEGDWVGMVGYFCPLIDKINEKGGKVLVLEKQPGRVVEHDGCRLTQDPQDLSRCQHILCTASTLVNESLEGLLAVTSSAVSFNLIGPSGSGLPDVLFKRGVNSVGGVLFSDIDALRQSLEVKESWKGAGRKYLLNRDEYPGVERLISRIKKNAN